MPMKNPLTPAGIEPATFRFVAQLLNHCATAVPNITVQQFTINNTLVSYYNILNIENFNYNMNSQYSYAS